jgi:hypothetical protein
VPQKLLKTVQSALLRLRPAEIRARAERPVRLAVRAPDMAEYEALRNFLIAPTLGPHRRTEAEQALVHESQAEPGTRFHLILYRAGLAVPRGWDDGADAFAFDPARPAVLVERIVEAREDLALALARRYEPFRDAVTRGIIHRISQENALFALASALPDVIPSLAEIPWSLGEFASDTTVLTVNQIRMAFLLAAASDHAVGVRQQRHEIGSLVAGAFGWRALAREAAGKIPFGGGLLPKAAIAYAGTWVAGRSLERIYRVGYGLARAERQAAWAEAYRQGRAVAAQLIARARRPVKQAGVAPKAGARAEKILTEEIDG